MHGHSHGDLRPAQDPGDLAIGEVIVEIEIHHLPVLRRKHGISSPEQSAILVFQHAGKDARRRVRNGFDVCFLCPAPSCLQPVEGQVPCHGEQPCLRMPDLRWLRLQDSHKGILDKVVGLILRKAERPKVSREFFRIALKKAIDPVDLIQRASPSASHNF